MTGQGGDGNALSYLPDLYVDELLYSFVARFKHHRSLTAGVANQILFGRENSFTSALPNRLAKLASCFVRPGVTAQTLACSHTLLPYLTAYRSPETRANALASMSRAGTSTRTIGGLAFSFLSKPDRLRFCEPCQRLMLHEHGELYWRRTHQLPISTMCPDHGLPLRESMVSLGGAKKAYEHATVANCSPSSPSVLDGFPSVNKDFLMDLSVDADRLLKDDDLSRDRRSVVRGLFDTLVEKGYQDAAGHIAWSMLVPTIDAELADIGRILPELIEKREGFAAPFWLSKTRHGSIRPVAETIILARRIADAAPRVPPRLGTGPWPCRNPIAKHQGELTIDKVSRHSAYGDGYRGLFECECGYSYTLNSHADGSVGQPRFSRFGPTLALAMADIRAEGLSLWKAANKLRMQVVVMLTAMEREGIPIHWERLPQAYRCHSAKRRKQQDGITAVKVT